MVGSMVKLVMRLVKIRMNMIKIDMKMLQARKQRAMTVIRAMESVRKKLPIGLRKVVTMEINNIQRNVRAADMLINSLMKEMTFLKSRSKVLAKRR